MFERKMKKSLLGYSKRSVDQMIEDMKEENQQTLQQSQQNYESQLTEYKKAIDKLEMQLEAEQRKLDPLLKENADLKYKNDGLHTQLTSAASQLDAAKTAVADKDKELSAVLAYKDTMDTDYSTILNNYNKIRMEMVSCREMIDRKNREIDALRSKLSKSETRCNAFIDASKELSSDIISSGSLFDEKLSSLRACVSQITQICSDTENAFNEVFNYMANFILLSSSNLEENEDGDSADSQKVS